MALQIRRGTNQERLGITLVEGEVVYVTDFELTTIEVTSVNATTNVLTTTLNHGLAVNDQVRYMGNTSNGLTEGAVYFVKTIPSQVEFTLSTTQGGTTLDITGTATSLVFATGPTDSLGTPYGYSISPLYVGDGITAGGNPAGSSVLDDLYDVSIGVYGNVGQYGIALGNNHVLQYNDISNQWENRADLTLNGNAYLYGDNLYINYDGNATDSSIYFEGTTARIKYDNADQRFEVNKDIIANGLQGGNVQIGINDDNTIYIGGNNLTINTESGYHIVSNAEFRTSADNIYINSDGNVTPSTLYMKGNTNYIRFNTSTNFFEFTDNIARGDVFLTSSGTGGVLSTGTGSLSLNTPSGQPVNVQRDLIVGGNLTVNGTTTTVNSTTLTVDDKNIELASTASPSDATADGGGITLKGTTDKKIFWDNATDRWYYDHGDGVNNIFVRDLTDISNVETTAFTKGDMFTYDGTNWINDNKVQADTSAQRATFQYNNDNTGLASALFARRNFTSPAAFADSDGTGIAIQLSNDNGTPTTFAAFGAAYSATDPRIVLRTSTDNFVSNSIAVADINRATVKFDGTNLILNANNTSGTAADAQFTVERGATGADATLLWSESSGAWIASNGFVGSDYVATNGQYIYLNNDDGTPGVSDHAGMIVKRGSGADVAVRWNETNDRWETTVDGSTYIELPNQDLDTNSSPTFAGVTGGNIRVGITGDNEIDTSTGNLTIDSAGGTTTVDDALTVSGNITHNGTTATFNNNVVLGSNDSDTLTVNATATFQTNTTVNGDFTANNGVTLGNISSDDIAINGELTTNIAFKNVTGTARGVRGTVGDNDNWFVGGYAASANNGQLIIATADDGTEPIYVRQYSGTILSGTVTKELTLLNSTGDTRLPGQLRVDGNYIRNSTDNIVLTFTPSTGDLAVTGDLTVSGNDIKSSGGTTAITLNGSNVTIAGDLTVSGTTTTLDTQNLVIEDNMILLNKNEAGAGITATTAGIEIERGSLDNVAWQFNENNDWWEPTGPTGTQNIWAGGDILSGSLLGTNGTQITMNNDDGAGADAELRVKKGGGNWAALFWNNATNRWQITGDNGSSYVTLPNQNLDTTSDVSFSSVTIDSRATTNTGTATTTSTAEFTLDSTVRNVIKAVVNITSGSDVHAVEVLVLRNGATAMITTYGEMYSTAALATFSADIDSGNLRLRVTPASATSTTFTYVRTSLT